MTLRSASPWTSRGGPDEKNGDCVADGASAHRLQCSCCCGEGDRRTLSGAGSRRAEAGAESAPVQGPIRADIRFTYKNYIYDYELEAEWTNVEIFRENPNIMNGLDALLDGMTEMFAELDRDTSGDISREEWGDYEADFAFGSLDNDNDGKLTLFEFSIFRDYLNGLELDPTRFNVVFNNPDWKPSFGEFNELQVPVTLKILKAGESGFRIGNAGKTYPAGTVFIELESEFSVHHSEDPYGMELSPGFQTPLWSAAITEDQNRGALGFPSEVDREAFEGIYSGKTFTRVLKGQGDSGVLDEYHFSIEPR